MALLKKDSMTWPKLFAIIATIRGILLINISSQEKNQKTSSSLDDFHIDDWY